ncbi:MAG: tetratricopeptide repeat protein [Bacteroidales bacterium]|nr:tetratricopeptide repeat protein [Bacteroidales bacterium]
MEASYLNLGVLGDKTGDTDKARKNFEESQGFNQENHITSLVAVYTNLGNLFLNRQDLAKAEENLDKAYLIARETNNQEYLAITQLSLGSVYFRTGRKPEAYRVIESGLGLS